ncbi:MAG: hypothetical protein M3Y87_26260 [Myxococcota bacterium]|nr:hypothetical protein [Myxococcota bacterium]
MTATRVSLVLAFVVGCGTSQADPVPTSTVVSPPEPQRATASDPAPEPEPAAAPIGADGTVVDGMWAPLGWTGAPDACAVDGDCMANTLPDASSPCCNDPRTLRPHSGRYRAAVQAWRSAQCRDVRCPPPPPPAMPEGCALTARCDQGVCRDSC